MAHNKRARPGSPFYAGENLNSSPMANGANSNSPFAPAPQLADLVLPRKSADEDQLGVLGELRTQLADSIVLALENLNISGPAEKSIATKILGDAFQPMLETIHLQQQRLFVKTQMGPAVLRRADIHHNITNSGLFAPEAAAILLTQWDAEQARKPPAPTRGRRGGRGRRHNNRSRSRDRNRNGQGGKGKAADASA
jgi:hypothetical protein